MQYYSSEALFVENMLGTLRTPIHLLHDLVESSNYTGRGNFRQILQDSLIILIDLENSNEFAKSEWPDSVSKLLV